MQLLLSGTAGVATAFVPSFELYLTLRFVLAAANAGFLLSTNVLRECLGPRILCLRGRAWKLPMGMASGKGTGKGPVKSSVLGPITTL